jgi:tetratricopeptide (TPR) repeat protein
MRIPFFSIFGLVVILSCNPGSEPDEIAADRKVVSLDGKVLDIPEASQQAGSRNDSLLSIARANYEQDPDNLDNVIWLGRRTAYLWKYFEAIDIYSEGIVKFPDAPELFRHRGHRYISVRQFDNAIADFEKAAELVKGLDLRVEPDGQPNRLNIPLSNLQFNIFYHWGLAHYLKGEFEEAVRQYEECMTYSVNADLIVATADWLYMTYRRLGYDEQAESLLEEYVASDMEVVENQSYLNRLFMYKGLLDPSELLDLGADNLEDQLDLVTQGYGVGNWYFYNDDTARATEIFRMILETDYWAAFGYIAAEADLHRISE